MWIQRNIDEFRVQAAPPLTRVVCAVDPPLYGLRNDLCCCIIVGLGDDGNAYVLRDASVIGDSPDRWGRVVYEACHDHGARLLAERGNTANLVASVMRSIGDVGVISCRHRNLSRWKRLEPIAAMYAEGRVRHVGHHDALELNMTGYDLTNPQEPCERLDALEMAISHLMIEPRAPNIRLI